MKFYSLCSSNSRKLELDKFIDILRKGYEDESFRPNISIKQNWTTFNIYKILKINMVYRTRSSYLFIIFLKKDQYHHN